MFGPYTPLRLLLEKGEIHKIYDIREVIHITDISRDTGLNYQTLTRKLKKPDQFTLHELDGMAKLFGVKTALLYCLIIKELEVLKGAWKPPASPDPDTLD